MKKKKSVIKYYEKILRNDMDFDWSSLMRLERFKISRMLKCQEGASGFEYEGQDQVRRDMRICISLLDIILQEDSYYKTWSTSYAADLKMDIDFKTSRLNITRPKNIKIPIHINTKNSWRFGFPRDYKIADILLFDYRQKKALCLYNKIRNRIFNWWV